MTKEDRKLFKILEARGPITRNQAVKEWCGKLIGKGVSRNVYECKLNPDWVVKIQISNDFCNIVEWKIWEDLCMAPWYAKWFAECLTITESGMVLIQRKVLFPDKKTYPKKLPVFFTDLKYDNYGFIDGQLKACDYSNVLAMMTGLMGRKMRNAKWWTPHEPEKSIRNYRNKKNVVEAKL